MNARKIIALTVVELKKLYRDIMTMAVLVLMPVALTLIMYFALGNVANDYYPPGVDTHFEYLLPGIMGYAVIYMGMMVALGLVEYRQVGLLDRVDIAPISTAGYLTSQLIANMIIATVQGLIVLLVAMLLGFQPLGGFVGLLIVALSLALLAIAAVGLGLLTAAISKDTGAAGGLAVIYILPMMMFGALLAVFNDTTLAIAKFTPNFYTSSTLIEVLHKGDTNTSIIWENTLTQVAIGVVIVAAGMVLFNKTKTRY
jgi:ABC-2 type transport system permease protein